MTESWYPIAIMIMAYSVIGLISALKNARSERP